MLFEPPSMSLPLPNPCFVFIFLMPLAQRLYSFGTRPVPIAFCHAITTIHTEWLIAQRR